MILVIGNNIENVQTLLNRVQQINSQVVNGMTIIKARLNYNLEPFIIAYGGSGKVNVSRTIQYVLDNYNITKIIDTGNAASLVESTATLGNVGISTASLQYDVDYTALGNAIHTLPNTSISQYPANTSLITTATSAATTLGLIGVTGLFGSADEFLATTTTATTLNETYGILFVDDNSATVGQMAYLNNIPYVVVKGVSNYSTDDAATIYNANYQTANTNANNVVYQMLLNILPTVPYYPTQNCIPCCPLFNICNIFRPFCWNRFYF